MVDGRRVMSYAEGAPISMEFGRPMENDMPVTLERRKSKPQIEFRYDGRVFSESVDIDVSSKFRLQIDFDVLKPGHIARPDSTGQLSDHSASGAVVTELTS